MILIQLNQVHIQLHPILPSTFIKKTWQMYGCVPFVFSQLLHTCFQGCYSICNFERLYLSEGFFD